MLLLKKSARIAIKSAGYLLILLLAYSIIGFTLSKITVNKEQTQPDEVTIYLKSNGVHTDIVVPVSSHLIDWSEKIPFHHTQAADSSFTYLGLGWGDKGFYLETPTWADLKASTAIKAATGTSSSAMHTTYYQNISETERCKKIPVSWKEYEQIIEFIIQSFEQNEHGAFIKIETDANYGDSDAFYEANGSYSLFTTCNTWTNNSLKAGGQKACLWTALDTPILEKYEQ